MRDCVRCSSTKDMLPLEELNFGCHREFRASGGEFAFSPLRWPRGELRARCRLRNKGIVLT